MASNSIHSEIARLNAIGSSYDRRREMEAIPVDHQFAAKIQINKIERFYGYIREEGYRDGKAIIGLLDGTEQEIKLVFPQDLNDTVDTWHEGQTVELQVWKLDPEWMTHIPSPSHTLQSQAQIIPPDTTSD